MKISNYELPSILWRRNTMNSDIFKKETKETWIERLDAAKVPAQPINDMKAVNIFYCRSQNFSLRSRAQIDRKSGEIKLARYLEVADEIENEVTQITLDVAKEEKKDAEIGDYLIDPLPQIDFGRIAAQTAKQVIVQKVREAERKRQFAEFKDRVGEVINGVVKRVEFGNVIVDLGGRAEGVIRRDETIQREHLP